MKARFWREQAIGAAFLGLKASGLHRIARIRGRGAILMFHHVRPRVDGGLRMNRGLEIEPAFLELVIDCLAASGFELVSLDQAVERIQGAASARPFAAVTFDDGYRDTLEWAAPILRRREVPFAIYVTPGFAEGSASAWWEDLEAAILRLDRARIELGGRLIDLPTSTRAQKESAGERLAAELRAAAPHETRSAVAGLLDQAGLVAGAGASRMFMNWDELRDLAGDRLCTIGVHTLTHPNLSRLEEPEAARELGESRRIIEEKLGRPARHLAYPYGGPGAAGQREFMLANAFGFASATTTRPGMVFGQHRAHLCALPRLSVNGAWQSRAALEILLSGLPFALWNRGRPLNVA